MEQQLTLNDWLLLACIMIGLPIAFVLAARLCNWLQNYMTESCKPTRPEVENGHPIGEPKPFVDNYKK